MKRNVILVLPTLLLGAPGFAQDLTDDDWTMNGVHIVTETEFVDRVGIGTQAPQAKLHITGVDQTEHGLILYRDQTGYLELPAVYEPLVDISVDYLPTGMPPSANNAIFHINHASRIGLGTRLPTAYLHMIKPTNQIPAAFGSYLFKIESENLAYTSLGVTANGVTHIGTPYNHPSVTQSTRALFEVWGMDQTALNMNVNFVASFRNWAGNGRVLRLKGGWEGSSSPIFQVESNSNNDNYDENVRFRILANGKVAVGDLDMNLPDGYRLYVDDGILTERLRVAVKNTTDWADHVFSDDYDLWTLSCIAAYIEEHQHLPGIPSAEEVAESGVDVAEMDAKLLSKIEELTLHMIRLETDNQKLAGELQKLKASIKQ